MEDRPRYVRPVTVSDVYVDHRKPGLPYGVTIRYGTTNSLVETHRFSIRSMAGGGRGSDPSPRARHVAVADALPPDAAAARAPREERKKASGAGQTFGDCVGSAARGRTDTLALMWPRMPPRSITTYQWASDGVRKISGDRRACPPTPRN